MIAIRRACDRAGVVIEEDPDAGGGSHGSLLFSDRSSGRHVRVVIAYTREISPGVQRAILQYLRHRAENGRSDALFVQQVYEVLEAVFAA